MGLWQPGQIREIVKTKWQLTALLHDFEVNSSTLKPEHVKWLGSNLGSYLSNNMVVLAIGLASRTGPDKLNFNLSEARAYNVVGLLSRLNGWRRQAITKLAAGEEAARLIGVRDDTEDGRWRGVFLSVQDLSKKPIPPQPRIITAKHKISAEVLLKWKPTKNSIENADPVDRRANRIAECSENIASRMGLTPNVRDYEVADIPVDYALIAIDYKVSKNNYGIPHINEYEFQLMDVNYSYGSPDPTKPVMLNGTTPLTPKEASDWLENPTAAYLWKNAPSLSRNPCND
jgi:hypothetical protein